MANEKKLEVAADKELYNFLCDNIDKLNDAWFAGLKKTEGVYGSDDQAVIDVLKEQNKGFHTRFCELFDPENPLSYELFEEWIVEISKDEQHLITPIDDIIDEFNRTESLYLELLEDFVAEHDLCGKETLSYTRKITSAFNQIIVWFTRENKKQAEFKLAAQQAMILELSTPVISLTPEVALLPLVGDIDTNRAKYMMDNVLSQCAKLGVDYLFIDMSGVVIIDTMVAHRIFNIVNSLKLLGVETILSGIRPEIAQTATQLGIGFDVKTTHSLKAAVDRYILN
ncbi:STAS domain-containing protein [Virgibacillus sp. 7505]|uniref:STAS domain-containing protein n=1 Tax=Virgibacillus sp. 7505 TaxID=2022548 RepID=UPI0015960BDA|nr:STAS domain-containing protein [Virgibacillus sp. 7505]